MARSFGTVLPACIVLIVVALTGCDSNEPVDFEPQIVVESYLEAGSLLSAVRLSRTVPLNADYDFLAQAVRDAGVVIKLLDQQGVAEEVFSFDIEDAPGVYFTDSRHRVLPGRTYRLEVSVPGEPSQITSETTVPGELLLRNDPADSLEYQGSEQLEVEVFQPASEDRQRVFIFSTEALDPTEENLTPFAAAIYDPEELELEDLTRSSSPLLNEANYDLVDAATFRIRLPWLAILFYGANELTVSSVDRNYYDYRRTADIQQGGSTLAPGEIINVLDHIEGGTGIFGSFSRLRTRLYVAREGELE